MSSKYHYMQYWKFKNMNIATGCIKKRNSYENAAKVVSVQNLQQHLVKIVNKTLYLKVKFW